MAPRKRKSPERRKPAKRPALALRAVTATGGLVGGVVGGVLTRHPRPVLGAAGFVVLFSFVAANALWYQPGGHPSPFLATRDPKDPNAIAGYRPYKRMPAEDVTTFRIERSGDNKPVIEPVEKPAEQTAVQPGPMPSPMPAPMPAPAADPISTIITQAPPVPGSDGERERVAEIQRELIKRGLYEGADDGVTGPRTQQAIVLYQQRMGLPQSGEAGSDLLAALKNERKPATGSPSSSAVHVPVPQTPAAAKPAATETARVQPKPIAQPKTAPANRPAENISLNSEDPVAAAIRSSENGSQRSGQIRIPPADIPTGGLRPSNAVAKPNGVMTADIPAPKLVLQIQRGLQNIAYSDVEVDGVAGAQTKAAIRRFEKHYRLPETGEPSEAVLKKLKAIGAL
ncbi:peptidoglycan-binding domain-containing protein [Neorhizobium sp. IRS_2294]|uniref:peptidoglycan-binding domain-containing protein n=1 Tax=unclassified Neorhizobium TaxID=2629175 RepID=UPI003D2A5096